MNYDNPKKKSEATDDKTVSSDESKPIVVLIENAEPSSNPCALSTSDKWVKGNRIETGMKALLPGAAVQSVATNSENRLR